MTEHVPPVLDLQIKIALVRIVSSKILQLIPLQSTRMEAVRNGCVMGGVASLSTLASFRRTTLDVLTTVAMAL